MCSAFGILAARPERGEGEGRQLCEAQNAVYHHHQQPFMFHGKKGGEEYYKWEARRRLKIRGFFSPQKKIFKGACTPYSMYSGW